MALLVHRQAFLDLLQGLLLALFMEFIKFRGEKFLLIEAIEHFSYLYVLLFIGFEVSLLWIEYLVRSEILCETEVFLCVFIGNRKSLGLRSILAIVFIVIALTVSSTCCLSISKQRYFFESLAIAETWRNVAVQ